MMSLTRRGLRLSGVVFLGTLAAAACDESTTEPRLLNPAILFTAGVDGGREIWMMGQDGTSRHRLTNNAVIELNPRWLPDTRIVFARAREATDPEAPPRFDIHVMDSDGSDVRRVSESPSSDSLPTPSRDAHQIAFIARDVAAETNYPRVFVMNMDGGNRHAVSPLGLRAATAAEWFPNDTRLLFGAFRQGETGPMELFVIDADGSDLETIPDPCAGGFQLGRWSWNDARISITCIDPAEQPMFVMSSSGSDAQRLTPPRPVPSTIGDFGGMWDLIDPQVLVARERDGVVIGIYMVDTLTGDAVRVADPGAPGFQLSDWWVARPID